MKVRFLMSFGPYRRGQEIDHGYPGAARDLARRGVLEIVEESKGAPDPPKRERDKGRKK